MQFLVSPKPHKDEHLLAFLMRISWLNHRPSIRDVMHICEIDTKNQRIPYRKLVYGDFELPRLAKALRCDAKAIKSNAARFENGIIDLLGQSYPADMLDFSHPKICHECISEFGYMSALCSLSILNSCPLHRCALSTHWMSGQKLKWADRDFFSRVKDELHISSANDELSIKLSKSLALACSDSSLIDISSTFRSLSLCDALLLIRFIFKFAPEHEKYSSPASAPREIWGNIYSRLSSHPNEVTRIFKSYERQSKCVEGGEGLRVKFPGLYDELYSSQHSKSRAYDLLKAEFETFISGTSSTIYLWNPNHRLISEDCVTRISCKKVMQVLGIRQRGLNRLIDAGLLEQPLTTRKGLSLMDKREVMNFVTLKPYFITMSELCRQLDVGHDVVKSLVKVNLISPVAKPDKHCRDWIFDLRTIKNLVEQLKQRALSCAKNKKLEGAVSIKAMQFRGKTIASCIENMLFGRLGYTFTPDRNKALSLKQFHPIITHTSPPTMQGYLHPWEVSKILDVNINAVYDLAKRGFLDSSTVKLPSQTRPIKVINSKSLGKFTAAYKLKPKNRKNLSCVSGPRIDGGVVCIYLRQEERE